MVVEHGVKPFQAAVVGEALVDEVAVEHHFAGELLGQAFEPLALGRCPVQACRA